MTEPVVALAAAPGTSGRAASVLPLLGVGTEIVSWRVARGRARRPDVVVVTSVTELDDLDPSAGLEVAAYVADRDEVDVARAHGVQVIWTDQEDLAAPGLIHVPAIGIDAGRWPPIAPLVRSRWRERLDLPARLVAGADVTIDPHHPATALAVASAAVVTGPLTTLALALGTPTVTNRATARRLGLRAGVDVEVAANPSAAADVAHQVAADDGRAAVLSRRGRRFAELHLDLGPPVARMRRHLGLEPEPEPAPSSSDRITARLDELMVPPDSPLRHRVAAALEPLVLAGASA